jgi:hypothetical protein
MMYETIDGYSGTQQRGVYKCIIEIETALEIFQHLTYKQWNEQFNAFLWDLMGKNIEILINSFRRA